MNLPDPWSNMLVEYKEHDDGPRRREPIKGAIHLRGVWHVSVGDDRIRFAWRMADAALGDTHTLYEVRSADAVPLWVAP